MGDNINWEFVERFRAPTRINNETTLEFYWAFNARYIKIFNPNDVHIATSNGYRVHITEIKIYGI
jgi:hypothetical protein